MRIYDRIASVSREQRLVAPAIANTSFADYLVPAAMNVVVFEREGYVLGAHELLATDLLARSHGEVARALAKCNFALVSTRTGPKATISPFEESMLVERGFIDTYCLANMELDSHFRTDDRDIRMYYRLPRGDHRRIAFSADHVFASVNKAAAVTDSLVKNRFDACFSERGPAEGVFNK